MNASKTKVAGMPTWGSAKILQHYWCPQNVRPRRPHPPLQNHYIERDDTRKRNVVTDEVRGKYFRRDCPHANQNHMRRSSPQEKVKYTGRNTLHASLTTDGCRKSPNGNHGKENHHSADLLGDGTCAWRGWRVMTEDGQFKIERLRTIVLNVHFYNIKISTLKTRPIIVKYHKRRYSEATVERITVNCCFKHN